MQKFPSIKPVGSRPGILYRSSSVAVLAASSDQLGPHGSVQVSTLYKSKLVQTHVVLIGPKRQQVLQLMMILYGLGKVHKKTCNGIPPFCPILSVFTEVFNALNS